MNYLLAFVLAVAGLAILIWNRKLSTDFGRFFARRYSMTFGRIAHYLGWDDPNKTFNVFLYRSIVFFLGLFLLLMAFHAAFGTIYTGSAAGQTESLLSVPNKNASS
jgi:hypothetical protein